MVVRKVLVHGEKSCEEPGFWQKVHDWATFWPFGHMRKGIPKPKHNNADARNLSASFCEHTWDMERIISNHQDSDIHFSQPAKSGGLASPIAKRLLEEHGPNALPAPKEISDLELYIRQFLNLLWVLLIVAATLSLINFLIDTSQLMNLYTAAAMYLMIWFMCTTSWWQEREARKVVRGFQNLLPEACEVIRDGKISRIPAPDLVIGDVIIIKSGTRVPADCRMLQVTSMKLETSSITGEAEPIEYIAEAVGEEVSVFESRNIAFNGSLCVDGEGIGIVVRTGTDTIIGQIASLTTGQEEKKSRFENQILRFVKFLVLMAICLGTISFVAGGFVHKWQHIMSIITTSYLVCAIGIVPCGLPTTITSILTVSAKNMASKSIYLKKLDIVEALGSTNIVASDKTGTLTMNKMTVTNLWYSNRDIVVENGHGKPASSKVEQEMLEHMCVCNSAKFTDDGKKNEKGLNPVFDAEEGNNMALATERQISGSPSEAAMLKYADTVVSVDQVRSGTNIVFEIPFNSVRKWQLKIAKLHNMDSATAQYKLLITGASDILLKMCTDIATENGKTSFDEEQKNYFQTQYDMYGEDGRRVIGFANLTFTAPADIVFAVDKGNVPMSGFSFLGVVAIMDPPRPSTAEAISKCKRAGIKVFMVTGDHPATAQGIARQIGMLSDDEKNWAVIHGEKIPHLTAQEWDSLILCDFLVFARTTPEQKLMIVEQCQKRKQVITMTGDGVNDSPALKKADVGIAMGSGSDVAKQAADIILMDDNFSSIVHGIEQGRLIFDNIKKLLAYTMAHCFPEVWPVLINYVFGFPQGISSLQILMIDLGTELLPGISMYKEPIEGDIMARPPRTMSKRLVSNSLLAYGYLTFGQFQSVVCFIGYMCVFWNRGISISDLWMSSLDSWQEGGKLFTSNGITFSVEEQLEIQRQACSAWQIGIVFGQFWHIFSTRTRRQSIFKHGLFVNWFANFGIVVAVVLLAIGVYVPGLNKWLGGGPVVWYVWPVVAAGSLIGLAYNEIRKWLTRMYPRNRILRMLKW